LLLIRTEMSHNHAKQRGGGLLTYAMAGAEMKFTAVNCSIHHNSAAEENGGAIAVELATVVIQGGKLEANSGRQFGGALFADAANVTVVGSTLRNNTAMLGGATYSDGKGTAWLKVMRSSMSGNRGAIAGGSIYLTNGSLALLASNISNSTAGNSGGAVYVAHAAQVKFSGCRLTNNQASFGMGAAVHLINSRMNLSDTFLRHNQVRVTPLREAQRSTSSCIALFLLVELVAPESFKEGCFNG
jgi:predicted outer membrane repeat protein